MLWVHSLTPTCLLCWRLLFAVYLGEASAYSIITNDIIGLLNRPFDVSNSIYSSSFAIKAPINLYTAALSQVNNAAWHSWAFKTVMAAQRRRQSACVSEIFRFEQFLLECLLFLTKTLMWSVMDWGFLLAAITSTEATLALLTQALAVCYLCVFSAELSGRSFKFSWMRWIHIQYYKALNQSDMEPNLTGWPCFVRAIIPIICLQ